MHREDNSNYLLYIEPDPKLKSEVPDQGPAYTLVKMALERALEGTSNYSDLEDHGSFRQGNAFKGVHQAQDGTRSSNKDYLLENGMITNSLAPYYLMWYKDAIPTTELVKLVKLAQFYKK